VSATQTTVLRFDYSTATAARRIERAIRLEVGALEEERSTVSLTRTDSTLTVDIEAADRVALRASLNSWLRYIAVAEGVVDAVSTARTKRDR